MTSGIPDTRISLIVRLANVDDAHAWEEFVEIYQEFIYRYAIRRGCQHSDAQEFTQNVLVGIAKAICNWTPDSERAKFRTWLFRIARNQFANQIRKRTIEFDFDFDTWRTIELRCCKLTKDNFSSDDAAEYAKTKMDWALTIVREQVHCQTWDAFRMSYLEGMPIKEVAENLRLNPGQVYVSRSRVVKKLKAVVAQLGSNSENS